MLLEIFNLFHNSQVLKPQHSVSIFMLKPWMYPLGRCYIVFLLNCLVSWKYLIDTHFQYPFRRLKLYMLTLYNSFWSELRWQNCAGLTILRWQKHLQWQIIIATVMALAVCFLFASSFLEWIIIVFMMTTTSTLSLIKLCNACGPLVSLVLSSLVYVQLF